MANRRTAPVATKQANSSPASHAPNHRGLTRKEVLLRADQLADLTALARRCMQQRGEASERITENSLVRIAIDLLLDNHDLLRGSTEDELTISILAAVAGWDPSPSPERGATGEPGDPAPAPSKN